MAKRIYASAVKKWAIGIGATSVPLAILLFWYLSSLGAIEITGFSGDQICAGTVNNPCNAYINMTAKEDIFIYPNESWSGGFYTNDPVKSTRVYRSWGSGWREINLTTNCKGTWCGAPDNKGNTAYSFAFRNNTKYQLKFEVLKNNPSDSIKWGFADVDPIFYGVDNQYKEYSEKNKEFLIKDKTFNTTLLSGKLISEHNVIIGSGYQKVAEFEFNSSLDLNNFIKNIELYDMKNNSKAINRTLDFKYKDYEDKLIYDYQTVCNVSVFPNGTEFQECVQNVVGNHTEKTLVWRDFNKSEFKAGNKTIGIFTDVKVGDYVEWVPTFYGDFRVEEWATWQASLEVNLYAWYPFNEGSGATQTKDILGNLSNITYQNSPSVGVVGLLNKAVNFTGNSFGNATLFDPDLYDSGLSFNVWVNLYKNNTENHNNIFRFDDAGSFGSVYLGVGLDGRFLYRFGCGVDTCDHINIGSVGQFSFGTWHMLTITHNTTTDRIYFDGVLKQANISGTLTNNANTMQIAKFGGHTNTLNGTMDEFAIYTKSLTPAEITNLYSDGLGCTYQLCGTLDNININLVSPANNTNTTSFTNFFVTNVNKTGAINIVNISLLINGSIVSTNTSDIGQIYNFSYTSPDGNHNWTVIAYGNDSIRYNATNGTLFFRVDKTAPIVRLPVYTNGTLRRNNQLLIFNISVTDSGVGASKCNVNVNGNANQTLTVSSGWCNGTYALTGLSDGNKTINAYANDTLGNLALNNSYVVQIDTTKPVITIVSPTNTTRNNKTIDLNVTNNEVINKWWYSNYTGKILNQTFTPNISIAGYPEGLNNITVFANDTAGNLNQTTVFFSIDTIIPLIQFVNPTPANNTITENNNWIYANVSVTEANFANITFTLFNSTKQVNVTTYTTQIFNINWTNLNDESYYYNVTIVDKGSNQNSTETRQYHIATLSLFLNSLEANLSAELNSSINLSGVSSAPGLTVCVDINHPAFGLNYSCKITSTTFNFSTNYFRNTTFSDKTSSKTFYYTTSRVDNLTIASHQYDEADGLSFNLSGGTNNPFDVGFFMANTTPIASNQTSLEFVVDRVYPGLLVGSNIYMNELWDNSVYTNLTFQAAGESVIYILVDDILQNTNSYTFFFNITGALFGLDYSEGNNTVGFEGFTNFSNIDTSQTNMQLDSSGAIMPRNVSRNSYLYDGFQDGTLDTSIWVFSSCIEDGGSGDDDRCVDEVSGEMRLRNLVTNAEATAASQSLNLSRFETDGLNFTINASYGGDEDTGLDLHGDAKVKYEGTILWDMTQEDSDPGGVESTQAILTFQLNKVNKTHWSYRIYGTENITAVVPGPDINIKNYFTGNLTYFAITNDDQLYFEALAYSNDAARAASTIMTVDYVNNTRWTRTNSTVISNSVYDASGTIISATPWFFGNSGLNETIYLYLSANDGVNWESVTSGTLHTFSNTGTNLRWRMDVNLTGADVVNTTTKLFKVNISIPKGNPSVIEVDFLNDGTVEYTYSGTLNSTTSPQQVNISFTNISTGFVNANKFTNVYTYPHLYKIPISIETNTTGKININDINLTYSPNPVVLNITSIQNTLDDSINFTIFRIPIFSGNYTIGSNSSVTIGDVRYDYAGGAKNITITLHDAGYNINVTRNITYYYSRWDYTVTPLNIDFIEFILNSPTSKNVTPFGQTNTVPILNISNLGYAELNANQFIYANDSLSCVNLYASTNNTKPTSSLWDGLVGYWPFDINGRDVSGNNNDGTVNGATFNSSGKLGGAYTFDGSNDYIQISNQTLTNSTQNFTIMVWFQNTFKASQQLINLEYDGTIKIGLQLRRGAGDPKAIFPCWGNGTIADCQSSFTFPNYDNEFYHAVITYNQGNMTLYINASQKGSYNRPNIIFNNVTGTYSISASSTAFNGTLDNVRIYNRTLSQGEISEIYSRESSQYFDSKLQTECRQ